MTPEYLNELADLADPDKLWRVGWPEMNYLSPEKKKQRDTGIALRRYASYIEREEKALAEKRSVIITPFSSHSSAVRLGDTPEDHARLRDRNRL